ncbi:hypothetical protein BDR07DRAFT_1479418 [Suillus spraguei]|nr:hypothetical protein BDR07DRAFT_1479418 [Suillus spraguei]
MHEGAVTAKELNIESAEIIALRQQLKSLHIHPPMSIPNFFGPLNPVTPVLIKALGPTSSSNPDELLAAATMTPSSKPSAKTNPNPIEIPISTSITELPDEDEEIFYDAIG